MRHLTLIVLAVLFSLTSCTKVQLPPDYDSIYYVMPRIEDGITSIYIETEELFPVVPFIINYSLDVANKDYNIGFLGITEPGAYWCVVGPAMLSIPLGELGVGNYNISFILDSIETNARLKVGTILELEIEEIKNIQLLKSPYRL